MSQLANTIAGRICNFYDFHGGGYVVDGACASSLIAIATACNALQRGDLDVALAGGVDVSLDAWELVSFSKIKALTSGEFAVYDRRASGLTPGEGCGFVVLKRLADARRDGDRIYALVHGWGISSDGKGGLTTPSIAGQRAAIERAYERAPYGPADLTFVEGHGTGTPVGDRIELEALGQVLEAAGAGPRAVGITSFKSIYGHTKGAAGIGAFLKAALAVHRRVVPPTANCKEPHAAFADRAATLYPITAGSVFPPAAVLRAGVSSMGFGGINCHITLSSADPSTAATTPALDERALLASAQDAEIFPMSAPDNATLAARIGELRRRAAGMSCAELADLAAACGREAGEGPIRAAVIASSPAELLQRLKLLEDALEQAPASFRQVAGEPVWIGIAARHARVGFVYPGQGSPRLAMGRVLLERHPWARERLREADEVLAAMDAPTLTERLCRPIERARDAAELSAWLKELNEVEVSQQAILLNSILWTERLAQLGVQPDVVCGHSQGEQGAFYAAGATDFATAIRLAAFTGRSGSPRFNPGPPGAMTILGCGYEIAQALVDEVGPGVWVAEINSAFQVVIAGEREATEAVSAAAVRRGLQVMRLAVGNAFHTSLIRDGVAYMQREAPAGTPVHVEGPILLSSLDGSVVRPGTVPRDHFCRMSLEPVDFVAAVRALAERADLLVEVGSGRVLSGLVASFPNAPPCLPVESTPGVGSELLVVLANTFVRGVDIQWEALFDERLVRPFVPASERSFIGNPAERPLQGLPPTIEVAEVSRGDTQRLAAATGLDPAVLDDYLARRGGFLAQVIAADVAHSSAPVASLPPPPPPPPPRTDPTPHSRAVLVAPQGPESAPGLRERLYAAVAEATGFSADSLDPRLRLLDDLNLDSLRAGEVVARVAASVGATLDASALANARLVEVEEAIALVARPPDSEAIPPDAPATTGPAPSREAEPTAAGDAPVLLCFGAEDRAGLTRALRAAEAVLAGGLSPGRVATWTAKRLPRDPLVRAAVVGATTAELLDGLRSLCVSPDMLVSHKDLWFGTGTTPSRLAFVFPGQGAQRPGMASQILARSPAARDLVQRLDAWLDQRGAAAVGPTLVEPVDRNEAELIAMRLSRTELTQVAVCTASVLWLHTLTELGLQPAVVAGHSLGELTALHAVGAFSEDEIVRLAAVRGSACAQPSDLGPGGMVSLGCGAHEASELLEGVADYVVVANINSPRQTVVSGTVAGVEEVFRRAKARGLAARALAVSNAFHSELVRPGVAMLHQHIDPARTTPEVGLTLISSVTAAPLAAGGAVADHLAQQLLAPVNWVGTATALAERADLIIEVGPGSTLTRLLEATLPDGPPCLPVESEPGDTRSLLRVLAAAFAGGHTVRQEAALASDILVWRPTLLPVAGPAPTRSLAEAVFLVLHRDEEADLALALQRELGAAGAVVRRCRPDERPPTVHTDTVVLMPTEAAPRRGMDEAVRLLAAAAAALPAGPSAQGVLYVQYGGGDLGATGLPISLATAHAASIHLERPSLRVRVVDVAADIGAAVIATQVVNELCVGEAWLIAAYRADGCRQTRMMEPLAPSAWKRRPQPLMHEDVVLVTGGAKGITATCALAMARMSGARVVLAGRSPEDHPEVLATLSQFSAAGLVGDYVQMDVTDPGAVRKALATIASRWGRITAVIHGAGVNHAGRVEQVSAARARAELEPKVGGLLNLLDGLADRPPRLLVAFTSVIGHAGMAGNAWYALANEATDLILRRFHTQHPEAEVLGIGWGLWGEVGMGARKSTQDALRRMGLGDRSISPGEGVAHFLDLLERDPGTPTPVVTFDLSALDTWHTPANILPLVDRVSEWEPGQRVVVHHRASTRRHIWLNDHRVHGRAVWPAVMTLEAMTEAAALLLGGTPARVEGEDLLLHSALFVDTETDLVVTATVLGTQEDGLTVRVTLAVDSSAKPAAEVVLTLFRTPEAGPRTVIPHRTPITVDAQADLYGSGVLFHGPAFQRIGKVWTLGEGVASWGVTTTPSPYLLGDPFARDAVLQGCSLLLLPRTALPLRAHRFRILPRPSDGPLDVQAIRTAVDERELVTDLVVTSPGSEEVERWEGLCFRLRERVEGAPTTAELQTSDGRLDRRLRTTFARADVALCARATPGIHRRTRVERQAMEEPLLIEAVTRLIGTPPTNVRFGEGAAPQVEPEEVFVSVSHTDDHCLVVARKGPVGCDLCPAAPRSVGWPALLGPARAALWEPLRLRLGDDAAGAALWAAAEAARKIETSSELSLTISKVGVGGVHLRGQVGGRAVEIRAEVVHPEEAGPHIVAIATMDAVNAAGAPAFRHEFPVTMRNQAGLGGILRFATFQSWMGSVRELAIQPIYAQITEVLATGEWGMVTNATELWYLRPSRGGTRMHCELHVASIGELDRVELVFHWFEERLEGERVLVAISSMATSWVRVLGHGVVKAEAAPSFFSKFAHNMPQLGKWSLVPPTVGPGPVMENRPRRAGEPADFQSTFPTDSEDGNLVGNIYFDRYALWASRTVDAWLHRLDPTLVSGPQRQGDWVGTHCRIVHLREAMPFDTVRVELRLRALRAQGFDIEIDFHKVEPNGEHHKLATGSLETAWISVPETAADLPASLRQALLALLPAPILANRAQQL